MKKNKLALALIISGLCAAGTAHAANDRYIIQVDNNKKGVVKALAKKLGGSANKRTSLLVSLFLF